MVEFENALKKIRYDVIGLSEVKRIGEEVIDRNDYIFMFNGISRRRGSVGFIVNAKWKNQIDKFRCYSDRVISLTIKLPEGIIGIIQCYAPTSQSKDSEIEEFYEQISHAIEDFENVKWKFVKVISMLKLENLQLSIQM